MRNSLKFAAAAAFFLFMGVSSIVLAESTSQYIDDATITTKVKAALLADSQLKSTKLSVETDEGTVQLTGAVDTKDQESEAVKVANRVSGVKSVKDLLAVRGVQEE